MQQRVHLLLLLLLFFFCFTEDIPLYHSVSVSLDWLALGQPPFTVILGIYLLVFVLNLLFPSFCFFGSFLFPERLHTLLAT